MAFGLMLSTAYKLAPYILSRLTPYIRNYWESTAWILM
jgi:hypothetical protein